MDLPTSGLRELSLFSGAGGGLLGTTHLLGWQTVCYVEFDEYAVRVLKARIMDSCLHDAPIWDDVHTFDAAPWRGKIDVVSAGFPCQPFSVAGVQRAEADERNGWPATIDIIRAVQPKYAFLENVPGLLAGSHGYFGTVLSDLAEAGYDARWMVLSAEDMGAPHVRRRLWIVATHTNGGELRKQPKPEQGRSGKAVAQLNGEFGHVANAIHESGGRELRERVAETSGGCEGMANAHGAQCERVREPKRVQPEHANTSRPSWWDVEPDVGRVANGVADELDKHGANLC